MTIRVEFTQGDRTIQLADVLDFLNARFLERDQKELPNLTVEGPYQVLSAQPGSKYIKIVTTNCASGSKSVYCFFDHAGNIYKAASWKIPAKHVRGSLFDPDYGWGKSLTRYGAVYLR